MQLRRFLSLLLPLGFLCPVLAEQYLLSSKPECISTEIGGFNHPGIFVSCEDLTRAQTKSLEGLNVDSVSTFTIRGPLPQLPYGQDAWSSNFTVDAQYAYLNSIACFISGHPFHRERALHATRRWLTELELLEEYIRGGNGLRYLTAACEILRATTTAQWRDTDTELYHEFARRVRRSWDETNGMSRPDVFMNQGAYANGGALSMAVFIGDVELYKQIIEQATTGRHPDPSLDYAIRRQIHNESDYYGQVNEMGRDQAHPAGTLNIVGSMAYTAEIQGDLGGQIDYVDLFKFDDYRLLAGLEYFAKFNLGHEVPFTSHQVGFDAPEVYNQTRKSPDRGIIYRNEQHPTDLGTLNGPMSAYYRYSELVPDRIKYFKTFVESQTLGLDSLLYMKEGNHEDLNFIWDAGYGSSYMDVTLGPGASRRFSKANETYESRLNNNTFPDIAVLDANTTVSYPAFFGTTSKPSILIEAMAQGGSDLKVTNQLGQVVLETSWPASNTFSSMYLNTTLGENEDNQLLFLRVSDDVEIARFNMTEMADATVPYDDPTIDDLAA